MYLVSSMLEARRGEGGGRGEGQRIGLAFYALPILSDFKRFYTTTTSLLRSL